MEVIILKVYQVTLCRGTWDDYVKHNLGVFANKDLALKRKEIEEDLIKKYAISVARCESCNYDKECFESTGCIYCLGHSCNCETPEVDCCNRVCDFREYSEVTVRIDELEILERIEMG